MLVSDRASKYRFAVSRERLGRRWRRAHDCALLDAELREARAGAVVLEHLEAQARGALAGELDTAAHVIGLETKLGDKMRGDLEFEVVNFDGAKLG